jgi:energy-coupling factor transporter ATP-binding protein EcfA2
MKTGALLSQKGGSGKSTLAVHLAVIVQATGRRTVIVDLDPQRSAAVPASAFRSCCGCCLTIIPRRRRGRWHGLPHN